MANLGEKNWSSSKHCAIGFTAHGPPSTSDDYKFYSIPIKKYNDILLDTLLTKITLLYC